MLLSQLYLIPETSGASSFELQAPKLKSKNKAIILVFIGELTERIAIMLLN
jgi:hypothetical protein